MANNETTWRVSSWFTHYISRFILSAQLRHAMQRRQDTLGQTVAPGLDGDRMADHLLDLGLSRAAADGRAQIDLVITQQAEVQPAIGGQAHAVASRAEGIADRTDEAELTLRAGDAVAPRRFCRR